MGMTSVRYEGQARRLRLLEFIRAEVAAGRGVPSPEEMRRAGGWSQTTSVRDALHRLVQQGHLRVASRRQSGIGWHYRYTLAEGA